MPDTLVPDLAAIPTMAPAPGTPAYNPAWYALTDIWWDPVNGADTNSGAVLGSPVKTFAEIVRRYGSHTPILNYGQNLTVHLLSSQPANQDPVWFGPRLSGGSQLLLVGTLTVLQAAFAGGAVTPKVRGGPGQLLLVASMPGGTAAEQLVFNQTRNSYAFVDSIAAGVATMQQPLTAASLAPPTGSPAPAEDNTWATGDTLVIFAPGPSVNLKMWRPTAIDVSAAGVFSCGWVQFVTIADSSTTGLSEYTHICDGTVNGIAGSVVKVRTHMSMWSGRAQGLYLIGNFHEQQIIPISGGIGQIFGGGLAQGLQINPGAGVLTDGDVILHGIVTISTYMAVSSSTSGAYADGTITLVGNNVSSLKLAGQLWGPASLIVDPGGICWSSNNTFVNNLLLSGALKFGTNTTGTKYAAGVWTDGVALTAANIDANNGLQDPFTGARFCLTQ